MKALCFFFLLLSFAYSQKLAKDRKASPNLGPWIKGQCQRPTSGKCSKALSCCPSFTGVKTWTRSCHGIGCAEAKLVKEYGCFYKCSKEASWAHWISQGCTPSCGKRKESTETFKRYCIDNKGNVVNDNFCPGRSSKTSRCKQNLPPCGKWTSWTAGECSKTCGKGTHRLTRECPKKNICFGDSIKYEDCQVQECGVWSDWISGLCSASCGGGEMKSLRVCSSVCEGDAEKVEACNTDPCRSGSWSVWMQSLCSKSCGGGTRTILRRCSIPEACEGSEEIVEECNTDICAENPCIRWPNYCENGGTCVMDDHDHKCICTGGWTGHHCDKPACQRVHPTHRVDAARAFRGITRQQCEAKGWCFDNSIRNVPWCFENPSGCVRIAPAERKWCPGSFKGIGAARCKQLGCCYDNYIVGVMWCYKQ